MRVIARINKFRPKATINTEINSFKKRPTLGPNVAAIICEIRRYWAILEKIFKIHGDIRQCWAILGDTGRY